MFRLKTIVMMAIGAVVASATILPATSVHAATCDPLPNVSWWSKSHDSVVRSVGKRYKGDWARYISRWQQYQTNMETLHRSGEVAVVKSRDIRMEGPVLAEHIGHIKQRIAVMRCLQAADEERQAIELQNLETAAGGNEVAALPPAKLDVDVQASCKNGRPVFRVSNLGDKWPRSGSITSIGPTPGGMVATRRIRMRDAQMATISIPASRTNGVAEFGLWVEPTWEKRPFRFDTKIGCN